MDNHRYHISINGRFHNWYRVDSRHFVTFSEPKHHELPVGLGMGLHLNSGRGHHPSSFCSVLFFSAGLCSLITVAAAADNDSLFVCRLSLSRPIDS